MGASAEALESLNNTWPEPPVFRSGAEWESLQAGVQEMICGGRYLSSDDSMRVFGAGRLDIVAGNSGLDSMYRASAECPRKLYHGELSGHGAVDLVGMEEVDDQLAVKKVPFLRCGTQSESPRVGSRFPLAAFGLTERTAAASRSSTSTVVSQPMHASVTLWP